MIPDDLLYHREHEWARIKGRKATVGISDFAQEALGDIVFLELPKVGTVVKRGEEVTEIESTKTTSLLYAPLSGEIVRVNEDLADHPERINEDPYGDGWIIEIALSVPDEAADLMSAEAYAEFLKSENE